MTNQSKTRSGSARLADLLAEMNEKGQFPISLLADRHGFLIAASAAPDQDADNQSAVVALVQKTAVQAHNQLGMAQADEISLYDAEGRRLVCRPFNANDQDMILAVVVPNRRQSYRLLTNQAIKQIKQEWRL